jgi:hypothetical protein
MNVWLAIKGGSLSVRSVQNTQKKEFRNFELIAFLLGELLHKFFIAPLCTTTVVSFLEMFPTAVAVAVVAATLPSWDTVLPDPSKLPSAGLQSPEGMAHFTVYSADNTTWGAYNHGPIITQSNGTFFMSWWSSPTPFI